METLRVALALAACVGCHRSSEPNPSADLRTLEARGGRALAHFVGTVPTGEPGEPQPPLEFGVGSLYFTFPGDPRRYPFTAEGELYFSDWSFDVFSPDGDYTRLLQSHYGPISVVRTEDLRRFLDGAPASVERITAPRTEGTAARVIDHIRWVSSRELEFQASCCGTSETVRQRIGGARAPQ